jgi:uncharacterized membrane protein
VTPDFDVGSEKVTLFTDVTVVVSARVMSLRLKKIEIKLQNFTQFGCILLTIYGSTALCIYVIYHTFNETRISILLQLFFSILAYLCIQRRVSALAEWSGGIVSACHRIDLGSML